MTKKCLVGRASVAVTRTLNRVHALGVRVSCPATETAACAGVVTLTRRPDAARMAAPRPFRVAPGGSTTVFLRPRASVLRALAQHRPVRLLVATLDRIHCPNRILERLRLGAPPHPGLRTRRT